jgi:hypothetical protein
VPERAPRELVAALILTEHSLLEEVVAEEIARVRLAGLLIESESVTGLPSYGFGMLPPLPGVGVGVGDDVPLLKP